MTGSQSPTVLLLDGNYDNTLQVAKELSRDLDARVVGVGASRFARLFYSRYCDERAVVPAPGTEGYPPALLALVERVRPDVVLPVGFDSVVALDAVRDRVPGDVAVPLPSPASLETAIDKRETLSLADRLGIEVPPDHTDRVERADEEGRDPAALDDLPFPLFLKARRETGATTTATVDAPGSFWDTYDDLRDRAGGEVIVQEHVGGGGPTHGCGVLFTDDGPELAFGHVEHRSVPPRGGSGTRLESAEDASLQGVTVELLDAMDWRGIALVEYKYVDGSYVLMEVNPKFWASYALASQCGYRFASTLVADALDLLVPDRPRTAGSRVFPLRELAYCLGHPGASPFEAAMAMLVPPTRPAFNAEDPLAWLLPPADAVRSVPGLATAVRAFTSLYPFAPGRGGISRLDGG